MQTPESNGQYGYIYYPIKYPNKAFSTIVTINQPAGSRFSDWVYMIDKSKFLDGFGNDFISEGKTNLKLISIGF